MYGVFTDIYPLIGSKEVVITAIKPVDKGGVELECDDHLHTAAFASNELLEDIGVRMRYDINGTRGWMTLPETESRYWKLTMVNSIDDTGDVHLPNFILSAEEVNADDIPKSCGL